MYVRPAWDHLYTDPEIAASWARFSTHKPREDGLRPESNTKDLEGGAVLCQQPQWVYCKHSKY